MPTNLRSVRTVAITKLGVGMAHATAAPQHINGYGANVVPMNC